MRKLILCKTTKLGIYCRLLGYNVIQINFWKFLTSLLVADKAFSFVDINIVFLWVRLSILVEKVKYILLLHSELFCSMGNGI